MLRLWSGTKLKGASARLAGVTSREMSSSGQQRRRVRQPRTRASVTSGRVTAIGSLVAVAVVALVFVLDAVSGSGSHAARTGATGSATHHNGRSSSGGGSRSRASAQPGTASVPILVYHVINARPAGSTLNPALYVPADEFASQMQALKANGWHAVTLDQLAAHWTRGVSLGAGKPIVITFDNGYASQYTNALPTLKGVGWVGVENLVVNGLPASEGGLTDAQIHGLLAAGWELDTQGLSHVDLTALDPATLAQQVTDRPADAACSIRRAGQLVQLSIRRLRPDRNRRSEGCRLLGRNQCQPRLGEPRSGPLSPLPAGGDRRHYSRAVTGADRRRTRHNVGPARVQRRGARLKPAARPAPPPRARRRHPGRS